MAVSPDGINKNDVAMAASKADDAMAVHAVEAPLQVAAAASTMATNSGGMNKNDDGVAASGADEVVKGDATVTTSKSEGAVTTQVALVYGSNDVMAANSMQRCRY